MEIRDVSIPSVSLCSVRLPLIGGVGEDAILKDLKSHMLGWYDPKRQKCTNESLAENPVLEDLSDGQYVFDFNEYKNKPAIVSSRVIIYSVYLSYTDLTKDIPSYNIKVDGLTQGNIVYRYRNSEGIDSKFIITTNGRYTVPKCFNVEGTGYNTGFTFSNTNEGITITMLPTKHPLELKNFEFGGLSGMGSYGTDLTQWINYGNVTVINKNKVLVPATLPNTYDFRYQAFTTNQYFKARCSVNGSWRLATNLEDKRLCSVLAGEVTDVYANLSILSSGYTRVWLYFLPTVKVRQDYTLEILPSYPDSLVFNGTTPSWVYDKNNLQLLYGSWINNYTYKGAAGSSGLALRSVIAGNVGEDFEVNVPSFKVRLKAPTYDLRANVVLSYTDGQTITTVISKLLKKTETLIVPSTNLTITPIDETKRCGITFTIFIYTVNNANAEDITIEFLPNYSAPTTKNYGVIPSLTQGAKCMMMDVTPLNYDGINILYSQDSVHSSSVPNTVNYFIMKNVLTQLAYRERNFNNDTYINGVKNKNIKVLDLVNTEHVIGVNTNNIFDTIISVGANHTASGVSIMALNSLILFDKELTEEEMKYVMKNLMKFTHPTDTQTEARYLNVSPSTVWLLNSNNNSANVDIDSNTTWSIQ